MFCSKCGSENKDEAKFCNSCGETIAVNNRSPMVGQNDLSREPKKKRGILKNIVYGVLILAGLIFSIIIVGAVVGGTPIACDDSDVKELLRDAIDQSQFARLQELSAIDIQNIQDTGSVEDNLDCTADITFNNLNESKVAYTVRPSDDDQYWLKFEIVGGV